MIAALLIFLGSQCVFSADRESEKLVSVVQPSPGGGDGLAYSQRQLSDGRWVKTGVMVVFYPSGAVESVQTVVDDVLDGMRWDYSTDGKLLARGEYKNGKPSGVWRIWRKDGTYIDKAVDPADEPPKPEK